MIKNECELADVMNIKQIIDNLIKNTGTVDEIYIRFPKTCIHNVLKTLTLESYENINFSLNTYDTHISITFTRR